MVELLLLDEIEQRLELLVGLAGVADDQGGAHHDVRHPGAGMVDEAAGHGDVAGAVHVPQHGRVGVLDRHVEVGQERVVLGHDVDHAQRQRAGVDVEQAQPGEVGHTLYDLREETWQPVLDAEVRPVADGVLGDEHDLLRPLPDEIDDLLQHVQRAAC